MAKKRQYDDDDGRVITPMNVDGMPWYRQDSAQNSKGVDPEDLSREETGAIVKGALKAGLLIGSIFLVACALFILFCQFVWFN